MSNYHNYFGIDIGKKELVVGIHGSKITQTFPNSIAGFKAFFKEHKKTLKDALVVLETTGGYEQLYLNALLDKKVHVHRADTRKVKNFIRSWGQNGKSDALDAQALALYGFERHKTLTLFEQQDPIALKLLALAQRRQDLNQMLVQEKNRLKSPQTEPVVYECCKLMVQTLNNQLNAITGEIEAIINANPLLKAKQAVLETIPGVGPIVSAMLLAQLPELGQLDRRQIASLCGLAPYPCESGQKIGYRRTKGGRQHVRSSLFMSAMAARRSNSPLKAFYEKLIGKGKKKMVALTALMRKIVVMANARIKELVIEPQSA
jgi:transposase